MATVKNHHRSPQNIKIRLINQKTQTGFYAKQAS